MRKKNRDKNILDVVAMQMNSTENVKGNLDWVKKQMDTMAKVPDLIVLPEVYNYRNTGVDSDRYSEPLNGKSTQHLIELAKQVGVTIIGGSIMETNTNNKSYNTTVVIGPKGEVSGIYRKMHLFDVDLGAFSINESDHFYPGHSPEIVYVNGWSVGLSICYDLRFPELFRWYFKRDVDIIVVPSSFTYETGKKHWHTLCRARAIENQCFIIAPNQCGVGQRNIKTFGHSLIVNPNGEILAEGDEGSAMCINATIDADDIDEIRTSFPIKNHQRMELG